MLSTPQLSGGRIPKDEADALIRPVLPYAALRDSAPLQLSSCELQARRCSNSCSVPGSRLRSLQCAIPPATSSARRNVQEALLSIRPAAPDAGLSRYYQCALVHVQIVYAVAFSEISFYLLLSICD